MRLIDIRNTGHGFVLDPSRYLDWLGRCAGVTGLSVTLDPATGADAGSALPRNLEAVLLDEILPVDPGCSHEIRFIAGTVLISCLDLDAEWCDERSS